LPNNLSSKEATLRNNLDQAKLVAPRNQRLRNNQKERKGYNQNWVFAIQFSYQRESNSRVNDVVCLYDKSIFYAVTFSMFYF